MSLLSDYLYTYFDEVSARDFYRDIFPIGELQEKGMFEKGKYNGIIVEVTGDRLASGKPKVLRHTLTDDLDKIDEVIGRDNFCLMSPMTYAGKTRDSSMGRFLYAMAFDVDGIQTRMKDGKEYPYGLSNMIHQFEELDRLPKPTYIVASGTGLHLYYVFEQPIPMFDNVVEQLEILKKELTRLMWHDSISKLVDEIQYEPVCQGFRMVGTITKNKERARAFHVGDKVDIEYLNQFVREEYKAKDFVYKSNLTVQQAKEKYPDWYESRIIEKKPRNTWTFNRRVYDRWLERIPEEVTLGHRYWTIWVLAVTAMKCDVSLNELEKDAFSLSARLNEIDRDGTNPFTIGDILDALEGYDSCWFTYPIDKMSYRTGIQLTPSKRNGRKQRIHLRLARANRDILCEERGKIDWREGNGRKSKEAVVRQWRLDHPKGKKIQCHKDTGLSRVTIDKYWTSKED